MRRLLVCLALLGAVRAAGAEEAAPLTQTTDLGHHLQGGLGVIIGSGYRGLVRYTNSEWCTTTDKSFCTGRLPAFLDLQGSFGATRRLSAILDVRLGLEEDFTHSRPLGIAPGVKYYIDAEDALKFFATFQLALDFTEETDVGVRNANGVQYDLGRHFGCWLQFGETIAFRRFFRFELDIAGGLEARL